MSVISKVKRVIGELLSTVELYNIQIKTKWIKSKRNVLADSLSRDLWILHPEIILSDDLYRIICKDMNFFPEIDLFSNGINTKCERFYSKLHGLASFLSGHVNIYFE